MSKPSPQTNWPRRAVVYQIYPRSFQDSNSDGVGDLQGIVSRLGYLENLGINAIWLSPVYKSPMADFGYDISDYQGIDPVFGTMEDFDRLVADAHDRGIKVIMDFVPNHTSDQHPWFLESRSSKINPKRNWYVWRDPAPDGGLPNNWLSHFGGSAWEYDVPTGQYYMHSFLKQQPDLNWRNPEVLKAMQDVMRFWLGRGVDGFRVDAVDFLIKDDRFRNDPENPGFLPGRDDPYHSLMHVYSRKRPETLEVLRDFCAVLEEFPGTFMLSEVYADLQEISSYYRACDNHLMAPFNFNLMALPWSAPAFREFIDNYEAALKPEYLPNYVISNHDQSRVATKYGQSGAKLLALLTLTLRGMIVVYYGEELGMEDVPIDHDLALDPWEHNEPGFKLGRDPQRTPMQWDSSEFAGFSGHQPWLPVGENFKHCNAELESNDTRSVLSLYHFLIRYRLGSEILPEGAYRSLDAKNEHVFAYLRESDKGRLLVLLNFSETGQSAALDLPGAKVICTTYLDRVQGEEVSLAHLPLRPHEGYLLEI